MTNRSIELEATLRLALEALKTIDEAMPFPVAKLAQAAIKEALEQPEHSAPHGEPVGEAYLCDRCQTPFDGAYECPSCGHNEATKEPVYTNQPTQQSCSQRRPLMDEQIERLIFQSGGHKSTQNLMSNPMQVREHVELWNERIYKFARAIEAAHGIKE